MLGTMSYQVLTLSFAIPLLTSDNARFLSHEYGNLDVLVQNSEQELHE